MSKIILDPTQDGITHINIYSKGKTELGKLLTNFAWTPFTLICHGFFASVEAYWYWLSTRDERLRNTYGFEAKKLGRELKGEDWPTIEDFDRQIKIAITAKIRHSPQIQTLFKTQIRLPLEHYYCYGSKIIDVKPQCSWMLDHIDSLWSQYVTK